MLRATTILRSPWQGITTVPLACSIEEGGRHKTPLVILHGLFGSKTNWKSLQKALARSLERRVIAVDLRNHGESGHAPYRAGYAYAEMAADVDRLLAREGIGSCDLMGHSMGGKAAALLALTRPSLLRSLIVVDVAPVTYGDSRTFKHYTAELARLDAAHVRSRREADELLKPGIPEVAIRQFLLTNLVPRSDGSYTVRNNLEAISQGIDEVRQFPSDVLPNGHALQPYTGPTLFLYGERDRYVRPEHHPTIYRLFPKTTFVGLDAGHWVHAEQPQQFLETVGSFVQANDAGTPVV